MVYHSNMAIEVFRPYSLQIHLKIEQVIPINNTFQCYSNDISYMGIFKYLIRTKSEKSNGKFQIYKNWKLSIYSWKRFQRCITYLYQHPGTVKYLLIKLTIHGSNVMMIVSTFIPLIHLNSKWFLRYSNLNYFFV